MKMRVLAITVVITIALVSLVSCVLDEEPMETPVAEEEIEEEGLAVEDGWFADDAETDVETEESQDMENLERSPRQEGEAIGNNSLIGFWLWNDGPAVYIYNFEENGLGNRGFFCDGLDPNFVPQVEEFYWTVNDGALIFDFGNQQIEQWSYEISNGLLTLISQQIVGLEYTYVKLIDEEYAEVYQEWIGVWIWEEEDFFYYEFLPDLRGSRPAFPWGREEFSWAITADGGLLLAVDGGLFEVWSFEIEEEVLTLTSRQVAGTEYRYIRD